MSSHFESICCPFDHMKKENVYPLKLYFISNRKCYNNSLKAKVNMLCTTFSYMHVMFMCNMWFLTQRFGFLFITKEWLTLQQ